MTNTLTLIRGLPGSGKTTLAASLYEAGLIDVFFEADHFFTTDNGDYAFDRLRLKEAHAWCFEQTKKALESGSNVAVSNTFTQIWEMQPYIDLAKQLGNTLQVVALFGNFGSIHNVPDETIERMKARWEDYPITV